MNAVQQGQFQWSRVQTPEKRLSSLVLFNEETSEAAEEPKSLLKSQKRLPRSQNLTCTAGKASDNAL